MDGPLAGIEVPCPGRKYVTKIARSRLNKRCKVGWVHLVYEPIRDPFIGWTGKLFRVYAPDGTALTRKGVPIPNFRPREKKQKPKKVRLWLSAKTANQILRVANGVSIHLWIRQAIAMRLRQISETR